MNQDIVKKYGIDFKNQIEDSHKVDKIPNTNCVELTVFLYNWEVDELDEDLLPSINAALDEPDKEFDSGNGPVFIVIYTDNVFLYLNDRPPLSIPTIEFKQIVEGWKAFLLTHPLRGAQV